MNETKITIADITQPFLEKIYSLEWQNRLLENLKLEHPDTSHWNWRIGFLKACGYTKPQMLEIIKHYCPPGSYEIEKTEIYIDNFDLYRNVKSPETAAPEKTGATVSTSKPKDKPFSKGIDVINHFFANTLPVMPLDVPDDVIEAAHYYYSKGYAPLPKHPEHKHPGVFYASHGVDYRNNRFLESQIDVWKWESKGICLLGNNHFCYLDIDNHPENPKKNGMQWLDESILRLIHSRHYERTASGGYHVYGTGNLNTITQIDGIEIRGNSALIVAYPTYGYKINKYI